MVNEEIDVDCWGERPLDDAMHRGVMEDSTRGDEGVEFFYSHHEERERRGDLLWIATPSARNDERGERYCHSSEQKRGQGIFW